MEHFSADLPTGLNVALQSDNGSWVGPCDSCQKAINSLNAQMTLTLHIQGAPTLPLSRFQVMSTAGKISLKSDTGKFVFRCQNCITGAAKPDCLSVMGAGNLTPAAQFTPVMVSNGRMV